MDTTSATFDSYAETKPDQKHWRQRRLGHRLKADHIRIHNGAHGTKFRDDQGQKKAHQAAAKEADHDLTQGHHEIFCEGAIGEVRP